ncbi:MAG: hypothetical protein HY872_09870 [Chloroflexi bacterium]|nr:hypothetical protein [Chloroflexota bacterium]
MTACHTIAIPHDDILQGKMTMDVFAADLWEVFKGRGVDEYRKPELFFQKTCGLLDLAQITLREVQAVLAQVAKYSSSLRWAVKRGVEFVLVMR